MSPYHRSDKEEWDEMMDERREVRRHHYDTIDDEIDVAIDAAVPDSWFWDDDREGVARRDQDRLDAIKQSESDMAIGSVRGRRKPSNGWDW